MRFFAIARSYAPVGAFYLPALRATFLQRKAIAVSLRDIIKMRRRRYKSALF